MVLMLVAGSPVWAKKRKKGTPTTRNVLTFVNTTAIAYRQNSAFLPGSWHHAIVVVFANVRTLRVSANPGMLAEYENFVPSRFPHANSM